MFTPLTVSSKVPSCLPLLKYTVEDCQFAARSVAVGMGVFA